ncbi:MAG: amidohydrolase family protein [Planctomycetales bacterium]|nr:amidohydrolase family protein [Planctomycetales bacterium]
MLLTSRWAIPLPGFLWRGAHVAWSGPRFRAARHGPVPGSETEAPRDLGDVLLLPGLVNAHAHLELTSFRGAVPYGEGFSDWIWRLTMRKRETTEAEWRASAREAVEQSVAAGTAAIGDVLSVDALAGPLCGSGLRGVLVLETLGASPDRATAAAGLLPARLAAGDATPGSLAIGLSPHSPYAAGPELLAAARDLAAREGRRLAIHVGETEDEVRFCVSGDGPVAERMRRFGVEPATIPPPRQHPVLYLRALGLLGPRTLCIHGNFLDEEELDAIARSGAAVAYCPRSHAFFGHPPHPVKELRARGIPVALGTDSLASNETLSILDEMRFLARSRSDLGPKEILEMATRDGARALGIGAGILDPGAPADLTAVALPASGGGDPLERLLAGEGEVVLTVAGGRVLHDPRGVAVGAAPAG